MSDNRTMPTPEPPTEREQNRGWPRQVTTTMQPDSPISVTEREFDELNVQGLLAPGQTKE